MRFLTNKKQKFEKSKNGAEMAEKLPLLWFGPKMTVPGKIFSASNIFFKVVRNEKIFGFFDQNFGLKFFDKFYFGQEKFSIFFYYEQLKNQKQISY